MYILPTGIGQVDEVFMVTSKRKHKAIQERGETKHLVHLGLYSRKCKTCRHLDPDEVKAYNCTYESGNEECPAREIQIVVIGQALRLARQVQQARMRRDPEEEAKILKEVSKQSEPFRNKFYSELESIENEHSAGSQEWKA